MGVQITPPTRRGKFWGMGQRNVTYKGMQLWFFPQLLWNFLLLLLNHFFTSRNRQDQFFFWGGAKSCTAICKRVAPFFFVSGTVLYISSLATLLEIHTDLGIKQNAVLDQNGN